MCHGCVTSVVEDVSLSLVLKVFAKIWFAPALESWICNIPYDCAHVQRLPAMSRLLKPAARVRLTDPIT